MPLAWTPLVYCSSRNTTDRFEADNTGSESGGSSSSERTNRNADGSIDGLRRLAHMNACSTASLSDGRSLPCPRYVRYTGKHATNSTSAADKAFNVKSRVVHEASATRFTACARSVRPLFKVRSMTWRLLR